MSGPAPIRGAADDADAIRLPSVRREVGAPVIALTIGSPRYLVNGS
ncbi:hypothetical protein [Micromonospora sp. RTGN7]|nr:hypothetical protein [Micromonospora sp. RTGN7]